MMDRRQLVSLGIATLCLTAIGLSATALGETVSTKPDDVIDIDFEDLPIGQDSAEDIDREIESNKGSNSGSSGGSSEADSQQSSDGEQGADAQDGNSGDEDGDGVRSKPAEEGQQDSSQDGSSSGEAEQSGSDADQESESNGLAQKSSGGDGSDGAGQPSLLDRLLALLAQLLPYVIALAVLASVAGVLYRYRERLLALAMVPFGGDGGSEQSATRSGHPWSDVNVTDDVQRAWYTMVSHLDVERPWAKTPDECRQRAVESGLDPEAVGTLTETFREVRYADAEPSPEQQRRARESLDRLGIGRGSA